jgi:hypothetical protein
MAVSELAVPIREVLNDFRNTYGSRLVSAELSLGRGVRVALGSTEKLMRIEATAEVPTERKCVGKHDYQGARFFEPKL